MARAGQWLRRADRDDRLLTVVRRARRALPGDPHFGDRLSLGGSRHAELVGRWLVEATGETDRSVVRETGLAALQLWQATLQRFGGGAGDQPLTILFTDLAGFSSWALDVGDDEVLRVLRRVGEAWEPPVREHGGSVVKRLGDGLMGVFGQPREAVDAVFEAHERLAGVTADGRWSPRMRAGLHTGEPRRIGDDYLGVDVNIAARVMERARTDELLCSGATLALLDTDGLEVRRRRSFLRARPRGTPDELVIYALRRRPD